MARVSDEGNSGETAHRALYVSGRQTREEILEAAMELFSERAYNGVSTRDIAAAAGVTHAGVRYHFPDKEQLLLAVLTRYSQIGDQYYEQAVARIDRGDPEPWGVLRDFTAYLRFTLSQRYRAQLLIMHGILAADKSHPAHDFFADRYRDSTRQYAEVMGLLQELGYIDRKVDVELAAIELIALVEGLQIRWLISGDTSIYQTIIYQALARLLKPKHLEEYHRIAQDLGFPSKRS